MKGKISVSKIIITLLMLTLLSGCGSSMMTRVPTIDGPDSSHALVTIIRPSAFGGAIKFGTWDGDNFMGILTARSYIQYKTNPGEHLFMARAENWSGVEASLQAGRHYFIIASPRMGAWKARVNLAPVTKAEYNETKINKWLKQLTPIGVIPETVDAYVNPRLDQVREATKNFKSGKATATILKPEDGI
jgi:hypothetical protein